MVKMAGMIVFSHFSGLSNVLDDFGRNVRPHRIGGYVFRHDSAIHQYPDYL